MKKQKLSRWYSSFLNIMILAAVAVLLILMILFVRNKLLQNAQNMGEALVQSYAVEEEMMISSLEQEVDLIGQYVDEMNRTGEDFQAIQSWLSGHFSKLITTMGEGKVDFYAVIDGEIVAANPWQGDGEYQYEQTEWYSQAVAAQGEIVCGEVYTDAITGQKIYTISKALNGDGDVIAMDVFAQNPALHNTAHTLPDECSYYLCDENGTLLYSVTQWDASQQEQQDYADALRKGIEDGSLVAYDTYFRDEDGMNRAVYYYTMSNGWMVLMTIPFNSILIGEKNTVVYVVAALALILFLILTCLTMLDIFRTRKMKKIDDTAHMLGDSFYAIYRVNVVNGTYERIKSHEDFRNKNIPQSGAYSLLLNAICSVVRPSTFQAFEENFSLESIRHRVAQGIADHGGDYQRRFGDVYRWVNIRTLYDPSRNKDEVILCFRDVDQERRRELQHTIILQEALAAAQKSTKAKSQFFSHMSHDMRTPLNAIKGFCDLAENCCEKKEYSKVLDYIHKVQFAGSQLLDLINDILELSRMEAGKHSLNEKELDLEQLIGNLAEMFWDRAREEGKSMQVHLNFRNPMVVGDEKQISQILNNLLSNAIKYSDPGDRILLEARQFNFRGHSKYQIIVEDTGIGMSPEFLEHLFDPYSRETTFSSRSTTGTGLGMAIVKSLVQQMSGEISVESTLGKGTRFTVTLPLKTLCDRPQVRKPVLEETLQPFDWSKRKILVAEDNELNREIVTELLKGLGAQVLTAVNGAQAVEMFHNSPIHSIDVILMDMQMPEMDGCQAASAIRQLQREDAAGVPIIAVTANAFAEDISRTAKAGMNDHISKPIDAAVLCQTMQKLIMQRESQEIRMQ